MLGEAGSIHRSRSTGSVGPAHHGAGIKEISDAKKKKLPNIGIICWVLSQIRWNQDFAV